MFNFVKTWLSPNHSLFFLWQIWYRFRYNHYFNTVEKFPLTVKQRQAIIVNEDRNLVVAGAGTGKTSTVIGKIGFLTKTQRAAAKDILVVAYNRNAALELRERIEDKLDEKVTVETFHSIGKSILKNASYPNRPHPFVDQEEKLSNFLHEILKRCLKEGRFTDNYIEYFKKYEFKNVDEIKEFKSERQYANWLRTNHLITLNAERVKSHGELLIANFLFANGIDYIYEAYYSPSESSTSVNLNYRPDFFLPNYKIYIEYFGIDEDGNTASFVPREKYHEGMEWKFKTHRLAKTQLIDLYFYEKRSGQLLEVLKERLKSNGVQFSTVSRVNLFQGINNTGKDLRFLKLVQRFLSQYKERQNSINLNELMDRTKNNKRTHLFLKIFQVLLNAYNWELKKNQNIDFGDMISQAGTLIAEKRSPSPYKYIIIDEFQDISEGRYDLILQLLKQNKRTKLFCVGDDWQAIYRFAGSDHQIMTNFVKLFGRATTLKLDLTFRYNNQIASVSESFITKNPSQIRKNLKTLTQKATPQIYLRWYTEEHILALKSAISAIKQEFSSEQKTLLLLSRYNHNKLNKSELAEIRSYWRGGTVSQKTIHSSKGLESDFVIITDLNSDHFGFPSDVHDDPILNLILPSTDKFEDSEERRLFYVALTRAKHQTHLLCDATCPSRFAEELVEGDYKIVVSGEKDASRKCPVCSSGVILKKTGKYGTYYECCNKPICNYKPPVCNACGQDIVMRYRGKDGKEFAICQSKNCKTIHEVCNRCTFGVLREVHTNNGSFLGCHEFSRTRCKGYKSFEVRGENNLFA